MGFVELHQSEHGALVRRLVTGTVTWGGYDFDPWSTTLSVQSNV